MRKLSSVIEEGERKERPKAMEWMMRLSEIPA